jgi:hypothetical protein
LAGFEVSPEGWRRTFTLTGSSSNSRARCHKLPVLRCSKSLFHPLSALRGFDLCHISLGDGVSAPDGSADRGARYSTESRSQIVPPQSGGDCAFAIRGLYMTLKHPRRKVTRRLTEGRRRQVAGALVSAFGGSSRQAVTICSICAQRAGSIGSIPFSEFPVQPSPC